MLYAARTDFDVSATIVTLAENCHTDAMPLVREVFVKNADFNTQSAAFALALMVLTHRYVGEQAQFEHQTLGIEAVHAMAAMFPWVANVGPTEPIERLHSLGELDIACAHARLPRLDVPQYAHIPLQHLDWSGDFVARGTRSSAGYQQGRYFTNAALVADDTSVSIAIALMHGGTLCRNIYVPLPVELPPAPFLAIAAGLETIGIALHFVETGVAQ